MISIESKKYVFVCLKPSSKSIPLLDNKPDNVFVFSIKLFVAHFPHKLLQFFAPKNISSGGFSG